MSVIDVTIIEQMQANDPVMASKFIELVLNDLSMRLQLLQTAAQDKDYTAVKDLAHAMKPIAGQIGAKDFSQICAHLEKASEELCVEDKVNTLLEQFSEMKPILESCF